MVALRSVLGVDFFDATLVEPLPYHVVSGNTDRVVSWTLGQNRTSTIWTDRRTAPFADFAASLMRVTVGPKDGTCYTPAVFRGGRRRMDVAEQIDVAVLDADCGHTADEIIAAVRARGWEAVVHSTFSHLTTHTEVSCKAYDKWRESTGLDDPATYMREKKGYLPRIVADARIVDERGGNYIVEHAPCPKFRVVLPLASPWRASNYSDQQNANAIWKERIEALAYALGMHHDQSCTDTSRLFYFPRTRDAAQEFIGEHIVGEPCDIWALPEAKIPTADEGPNLFSAAASRPAAPPRAVEPTDKAFCGYDGQQINLTHWAVSHGGRFEVVAALRQRMPAVFGQRKSGVKYHMECPFDDEHTAANDRTGTYAVNASDIGKSGLPSVTSGFYLGCKHNSCTGRDRLDFLHKILEKGWLTVPDLTDQKFLAQEPYDLSPADTSALLAKLKGQPSAVSDPENDPGNMPSHLLESLPGAMGAIFDFLVQTNHRRQPVLALGATLAAMSAAIGRKVEVAGWGTRPNIYILGIATTGAGKDRNLSGVKDILRRAGLLEKLVGAEDVSSDSGLLAEARKPGKESHVMLIDEVGKVLAAVGDRNAPTHLRAVATMLLKLYSASNTTFKSKAYVDERAQFMIDQPNISLFGATTPEMLFRALRTDDIAAGLLSRMMVFDAGKRFPRSICPQALPVPQIAIEWFQAWDVAPTNPNPVATVGGHPIAAPRSVPVTAGAQTLSDEFNDEMYRKTLEAQASGGDAIYVRAHENALKLALIRGCARGPDLAEIDETTMRWAIELSRAVTEHMSKLVVENVADSPFQRHLIEFRKVIKDAGPRGATPKDLMRRKQCQLPTREFEAVMSHLVNSGEIAFINVNQGKLGSTGVPVKSRNAYVWTADMPGDEGDEEGG